MKPISGAVPLAALEAVAVDTETTGLDTATARIVQIAGVAIALGTARADEMFETLVDPGEPIPTASTNIHGIDDDVVGGAPSFAEALRSFETFRADRVVIGHSIGFDLAVLEAEAQRSGIPWKKPRTLCVRMLGTIANPRLPEDSLDALASWLSVKITGRHSASGDALAAAEIFVALAPLLAARGIKTLAQAERACLALTDQLESAYRAGWLDPVSRPDHSAINGIVDPYAYRHRVRDLMSKPVVVVPEGTTAKTAIDLMTERRISSIFVSATGKAAGPVKNYGIVTERDVMRLLAAQGPEALFEPVGNFASRPLASIAGGAFVYRAIGRMQRLGIRHLAVRNERERLAGVISARDLLRLRAGAAINLDDAIDEAKNTEEMARAWSTLPAVARLLVAEDFDARLVAGVVSEETRIMSRRAAELAESAMLADGVGAPPCSYALMVLGSGGRGESLLAPDQDNAIVFEHGEPDGPEDRWFSQLGSRVADVLDAAGIPYCTGGVMARNSQWRGSLVTWKHRIEEWVGRARADDLLNVDIFFDQRPVHGSLDLGAELFEHAYASAADRPPFAKLLSEKLFDQPSPLTFLGGFQTVEGRIDLKLHGLFPIVTAARSLALRHGIRRRSTKGRLEGLVERQIGNSDEIQKLVDSHGLSVALILKQQSDDLEAGIAVSNKVEIASLSRARQTELKAALKAAQYAPEMVRGLMFG